MREELKNTIKQNVAGGLQSPSLACCKELALLNMHVEGEPVLWTLKQIGIRGYSPLTLFAHHTYGPL